MQRRSGGTVQTPTSELSSVSMTATFMAEVLAVCIGWFVLGTAGLFIGVALCFWNLRVVFQRKTHPILTFRMLALTAPGLAAALLKLYDPNGLISVYFARYQTYEFTAKAVLVCAGAGVSTTLAWRLAEKWEGRRSLSNAGRLLNLPPSTLLFIAAAAWLLDLPGRGAPVWNASYGLSDYGTRLLGINVYGAVAIGALASWAGLVLITSGDRAGRRLLVFGVLGLFCLDSLVRGERSETLALVVGVYCMLAFKHQFLRSAKFLGVVLTISVLLSLAVASVRVYLETPDSPMTRALQSMNLLAVNETYVNGVPIGVYGFAEIPAVGMGFLLYGVLGLVDEGNLALLGGRSYVDHLVNTIPESLNPWRRENISWYLTTQGYESAGGMLEVAEAYLNFGLVGVFLVPLVVSFFFFVVTFRAQRSRQPGWLALAAACGTLVIRGTLYGTNDSYKAIAAYLLCVMAASLARRAVPSVNREPQVEGSRQLWMRS